jgi:hypothetical protein
MIIVMNVVRNATRTEVSHLATALDNCAIVAFRLRVFPTFLLDVNQFYARLDGDAPITTHALLRYSQKCLLTDLHYALTPT